MTSGTPMVRRSWIAVPALLLTLVGITTIVGTALFVDREVSAPVPLGAPMVFEVHPGDSAIAVGRNLRSSGAVVIPSWAWNLWVRWTAPILQAGEYSIAPGDTARTVVARIQDGRVVQRRVILLEGIRFSEMLQMLRAAPRIVDDVQGLEPATIMERLGKPGIHPEGRFFPDTYAYAAGSGIMALLERAAERMDQELLRVWQTRESGSPLEDMNELLVLASIVEKETGRDADRALIAGVFTTRLHRGMRLQTDPTVIYGLGEAFDGNLTRAHLRTDQPWNTYTRHGLPPTPICLPGRSSLVAAAQPTAEGALYFVARGDGGTEFSENLPQHQAAVRRFQLGQRSDG